MSEQITIKVHKENLIMIDGLFDIHKTKKGYTISYLGLYLNPTIDKKQRMIKIEKTKNVD